MRFTFYSVYMAWQENALITPKDLSSKIQHEWVLGNNFLCLYMTVHTCILWTPYAVWSAPNAYGHLVTYGTYLWDLAVFFVEDVQLWLTYRLVQFMVWSVSVILICPCQNVNKIPYAWLSFLRLCIVCLHVTWVNENLFTIWTRGEFKVQSCTSSTHKKQPPKTAKTEPLSMLMVDQCSVR